MDRTLEQDRSAAVKREQEFYRVEGGPPPGGGAECRYVAELESAPNGQPLGPHARAALWYLAYFAMNGVTRPSLSALAMHLNETLWMARLVVADLVDMGILRPLHPGVVDPVGDARVDVREFVFVALEGDLG
jgi:hypothetical protein